MVLLLLDEEDDRADVRETLSWPRRADDLRNRRLDARRRHDSACWSGREPRAIEGNLERPRLDLGLFAQAEDRDVDARTALLRGRQARGLLLCTVRRAAAAPGIGVADFQRNRAIRLEAEHQPLGRCDANEGDHHDGEPGGQSSETVAQHGLIVDLSARGWQILASLRRIPVLEIVRHGCLGSPKLV